MHPPSLQTNERINVHAAESDSSACMGHDPLQALTQLKERLSSTMDQSVPFLDRETLARFADEQSTSGGGSDAGTTEVFFDITRQLQASVALANTTTATADGRSRSFVANLEAMQYVPYAMRA